MLSAWGIRSPAGSQTPQSSASNTSDILQQPGQIAVEVSSHGDSDGYISFAEQETTVRRILKELPGKNGHIVYKVRFRDNHHEEVWLRMTKSRA
jgi:hypothetical protein